MTVTVSDKGEAVEFPVSAVVFMSGSSPSGALKRRSLKLSRKSVESEDMNNVDEEEADATPAPVNDSAVDASTPASNRSTPLASPAIDSLPVEKKKGKQRKVDSVAKATDDSDPRPKSSPAAPAVNKLTRYFLVAPSPSVGHPVGTPPGVKTDDADSIRAPPAFVTSSPQADDAHHFRVIVVDNCEKMASELVQLARDSALSAHSFHLATYVRA